MTNLLQQTRTANEIRFAYRVRQALNESAGALSPERVEKLAAARKAALRVQKADNRGPAWATRPALAGAAGTLQQGRGLGHLGRMSLGLGSIAVVGACLIGLFQFEQQRHIEELADIDAAVLTDDVPISAYADHGFNAYIKQNP